MDNFISFCVGCVITTLVLFWLVAVPFLTPNNAWHNFAIKRGYALYCPNDGEFAWKGECKDD